MSGVAPQSNLASWVIFGTSFGQKAAASNEQLMDIYQYASNHVAVQNYSWDSASTAQHDLGSLEDSGIADAVTLGRGGKDVVMIHAASNSRSDFVNANDDGTTDSLDPNSPGVYTTDRTVSSGYATGTTKADGYDAQFNGTSASSPEVAGVAALVLRRIREPDRARRAANSFAQCLDQTLEFLSLFSGQVRWQFRMCLAEDWRASIAK